MGSVPMTFCTSLLTLRRFVEKDLGAGAFAKVRAALRDAHGVELPPILAPGAWYPTIWFLHGLDEARALSGRSDFFERFGRAAAMIEIPMLFRFVLKLTSPRWLFDRGVGQWQKAHDTGRWTAETGETFIRGTLADFGHVHEGQCRSLTAWFGRAFEMTQTPAVVTHPTCRALGGPHCVFDARW